MRTPSPDLLTNWLNRRYWEFGLQQPFETLILNGLDGGKSVSPGNSYRALPKSSPHCRVLFPGSRLTPKTLALL
jgi:hypothetical protein